MGLFDALAGQALGAVLGQKEQEQVGAQVAEHLQQGGNLADVVSGLAQGGLGDAAKSWVGTGPNQNVATSVLVQAIQGSEWFQGIAQKTGLPPAVLGPVVAQLLPTLIDKLTPGGKLPSGG